MNQPVSNSAPGGWNDRMRRYRRRQIKSMGRFLLHTLSRFMAWQSLIGDKPVFDKSVFPWIAELENHWAEIRAELETILVTRDQLPSFHELSPDQKRISKGDNWKTYVFYVFGDRIDKNCERCPATAGLLAAVPDIRNAWFSILSPHYHIPPHQGPTKGIIRIHLGLIIPQARDDCWIRVDNEVLHWDEGKCVVFDDFFEHEVKNNTPEQRVVLFLDVDRPMRLPGRLVNQCLIAAIKRSAYVQDAHKNLRNWEHRTRNTDPTQPMN